MDASDQKFRPWMWIGAAAWVLLIAFVGIRLFAISKIPADVREGVAELERTQVSLPRDWHRPAVLPPTEVVAFHRKFKSDMEAIRKKYPFLIEGSGKGGGLADKYGYANLTADDRTSLSFLMADLQPLIDETSQTVRLQGYVLELDLLIMSQNMSFLELTYFSKLMVVVAREKARNGDCIAALETAALPLRLVRRPEQSYLMTHLISVAFINIAAEALFDISTMCANTTTLQYCLSLMDELRDVAFPGDSENWYFDHLVSLRFAAAYGYPVILSPQSRAGYVKQYAQLFSRQYYQWLVDQFPPNDPKVKFAKDQIDGFNRRASSNSISSALSSSRDSGILRKLLHVMTGLDPDLVQYGSTGGDLEVAMSRSNVARAKYDLTRLDIARRLVASSSSNTTRNGYLSPLPLDPFTSSPFLFSQKRGTYYSVGPDGKDDGAGIPYVSVNESSPTGDIWMGEQ